MATKERLILASGSEGRRDLLRRAGYSFEVIPSGVDEPPFRGFPGPRAFVQYVAWLKAEAVAAKVDTGLILAADSVAWINGKVIGKPADLADAERILRDLSGTVHELWTGVCLWQKPSGRQLCWQEFSRVHMRSLTDRELADYLDTGIWEGKSGAYAIQEKADPYVRVVNGSTSNVIGLPLESLAQALSALGFQGV